MTKGIDRAAGHNAQAAPEEDLSLRPWKEADDLDGWEVVADSESNGPMGFVLRVTIEPAFAPAVVRAAREAHVDVGTFLQRLVGEQLRLLAAREPDEPSPRLAG